jgi:hypothetical protein
MLTHDDIARCARAMIRQYGTAAAARAQRHAEASRDKGWHGVHAIWIEVGAVAQRLQTNGQVVEETPPQIRSALVVPIGLHAKGIGQKVR